MYKRNKNFNWKRNDSKKLEEGAHLKFKVKRVRMEENLGKQIFHYDTKIQKLQETKSTTKPTEEVNEVYVHETVSELATKYGKIDKKLMSFLTILPARRHKSLFRLYDHHDGDKCDDYIMTGKIYKI